MKDWEQSTEHDPETEVGLLSGYARLLCLNHRAQECSDYAQRGLDAIDRMEELAHSFHERVPLRISLGKSGFDGFLADALMLQGHWKQAEEVLLRAPHLKTSSLLLSRLVVALLKQPDKLQQTHHQQSNN